MHKQETKQQIQKLVEKYQRVVEAGKDKKIYPHLDMKELENKLKECLGNCQRVIIVTDGVFSMRGDYPDLKELMNLARKYHPEFKEGIFTIVDDSHGVGAFGKTGRGTSEVSGENNVDILVSTLGKALGVNGGYETIRGEHPIVALIVRDTQKTIKLVNYLKERGILVVGLKYPVVPKGDECIRFQISTDHTKDDLDYVLKTLGEKKWKGN